jgi:hypothetical protein
MSNITKEMVQAGMAVLCRMTTYIADEEYWAEEVYKAMEAAKPNPFHVSKETVIRLSKEVSDKFMENNRILNKVRGKT